MTNPTVREEIGSPNKIEARPPRLDVRSACLRFGRIAALQDVSLAMEPGDIVAVLGESGCGKSSLLRLVAGLEAPQGGEIRIDGRLVASRGRCVPPEARGIGLMFQDHALFPHLSVLDNVRFGLNRLPRARGHAMALTRLAEVGLADRAADYPHVLSGGEAQRVALARALAPEPRLLLLDEPFSSLDPSTRTRIRSETLALLRAGGTTAILVTHDPAEALDFADRIVLMRRGRVVQSGSGADIHAHPVSPFAARALGPVIEIAGQAMADRIATALGPLPAPAGLSPGPVTVCLRADAIRVASGNVGVPARVLARKDFGRDVHLRVVVDGLDGPILLTAPAALAPPEAATVLLSMDPADAHIFSADAG